MAERRQEIENIIIGTLLESDSVMNYFDDCRSCLSADMIRDLTNKRIYLLIVEMNRKGITDTRPYSIFVQYGESVADIVPRMCELVADWSFIHKKTQHNEVRYLYGLMNNVKVRYTDVRFVDYVEQFIKISLEDDKESRDRRRGKAYAA